MKKHIIFFFIGYLCACNSYSMSNIENISIENDLAIVDECSQYIRELHFSKFNTECVENLHMNNAFLQDIYLNVFSRITSLQRLHFEDTLEFADAASKGFQYIMDNPDLLSEEHYSYFRDLYVIFIIEILVNEKLLHVPVDSNDILRKRALQLAQKSSNICIKILPTLYLNFMGLKEDKDIKSYAKTFDSNQCYKSHLDFSSYILLLLDLPSLEFYYVFESQRYETLKNYYRKLEVDIALFYSYLNTHIEKNQELEDYLDFLDFYSVSKYIKQPIESKAWMSELYWMYAVLYASTNRQNESIDYFNKVCDLFKEAETRIKPKQILKSYSSINTKSSGKIEDAYANSSCI